MERVDWAITLSGHSIQYRVKLLFEVVEPDEYVKHELYEDRQQESLLNNWHNTFFAKILETPPRFFIYDWSTDHTPWAALYQAERQTDGEFRIREESQIQYTAEELRREFGDYVHWGCRHNLLQIQPLRSAELEIREPVSFWSGMMETVEKVIQELRLREAVAMKMMWEIEEWRKRYVNRTWKNPPLEVTVKQVEDDNIEISWDWSACNWSGRKKILGFRTEGSALSPTGEVPDGSMVVDNTSSKGSVLDHIKPDTTYAYKFYIHGDITPGLLTQGGSYAGGLLKFLIRIRPRNYKPFLQEHSEEAYLVTAKINRAGAEAIRARAQFEQEKKILEELLKPQQESSKEAKIVTQEILRGLDEAFEREREREVWYGNRLKKLAEAVEGTDITQEQAERLEQFLYNLHVSGNP